MFVGIQHWAAPETIDRACPRPCFLQFCLMIHDRIGIFKILVQFFLRSLAVSPFEILSIFSVQQKRRWVGRLEGFSQMYLGSLQRIFLQTDKRQIYHHSLCNVIQRDRRKSHLSFEIDVKGVFLIIEFRGFLVCIIVKYSHFGFPVVPDVKIMVHVSLSLGWCDVQALQTDR